MSAARRIVWAVHLVALVVWFAALASGAIAAMNVFPTMDELPLILADHPDYPADRHPRLAASRIMEGVFVTGDLLQVGAAIGAVVTLLVQLLLLGCSLRRPAHLVRSGAIAVASVLLTWHVLVIAPSMYGELRAWWGAAAEGRADDAETHRQAFNAMHPPAERLQGTNLFLVLVAVVGAASALAAGDARPPRPPASVLETPKLVSSP